jgi:hypothetical protein
MVTLAMADYGERNAVHSHSQAGFRGKRTTSEQIENLVMALEDAKQFQQDIYLLQIDFSKAFDTVNHAKLLQIMQSLKYPADAQRVVKDLYTEATTAVRTPYGYTEHIPIRRGTIQGDSLSPYLFILYLETLLRWLKVGARGYQFKAIDSLSERVRHQMADCTYADELNALTRSISDLAIQADKITAYADWADLRVNMTKSSATVALHASCPSNPYDPRTAHQRITNRVTIQGTAVQVHPPKQPFKYLGIHLTMDLQWNHQFTQLLATVKNRLSHLNSTWLARHHKLRVISSCIRPVIRYTLPVAPYTRTQLQALDAQLTATTKQAMGLPVCAGTAFAHEDLAHGGLSCPSLQVEYHQVLAERLLATANDATTTGHITRAMLKKQLADANSTHSPAGKQALLNWSLRLRQLEALQNLTGCQGITLQQHGKPVRL